MQNNQKFDQLNQHFHDKIYGSFKGRLRLSILNRDFDELNFHQKPLKILDVGGGSGIFSHILAKKGHQITLVEPSTDMLLQAKHNFEIDNLDAVFIQASAEELPQHALSRDFDLLLIHAVLEWTDNPMMVLLQTLPFLKHGGHLSLLFYNQNGLIMHNLIRGNFRLLEKDNFTRHPGSLTPTMPLDPNELSSTLITAKFTKIRESGVRIFHDYMTKANQEKIDEKERLAMELKYSSNPSFIHTSRYLHWIYKKHDG